jgi:trehalose/maltose transport system substrate-binding protein
LAVSRFSAHPREALELIQYLIRRDLQVKRASVISEPPTLPELYNLPEVLEPNPRFALLSQAFQTGAISRPSNVTGNKYPGVTDAYIQEVHSVLTGQKSAPEAAAALENELVRITGFKKGPPPGNSALNGTLGQSRTSPPPASASSANDKRRGVSSKPAIAR